MFRRFSRSCGRAAEQLKSFWQDGGKCLEPGSAGTPTCVRLVSVVLACSLHIIALRCVSLITACKLLIVAATILLLLSLLLQFAATAAVAPRRIMTIAATTELPPTYGASPASFVPIAACTGHLPLQLPRRPLLLSLLPPRPLILCLLCSCYHDDDCYY